jgi:hypothetical protein
MKEATGAGNVSQIVLLLDSPPDEHHLRKCLDDFVGAFPVLAGKVARDFTLAPYWKIPATMERKVVCTVHSVAGDDSEENFLAEVTADRGSSFGHDDGHLAFRLYVGTSRHAVSMMFDHRLFDARGAESFLALFQESLESGPAAEVLTFSSSAELSRWQKKFQAGKNVNRRMFELFPSDPLTLPLPERHDRGFRYRLLAFSEAETRLIYDRAYRDAGYLMESLYLLAVITQSMNDLFTRRNVAGECHLVPVTVDQRPGLDTVQEIFFNHVSYLFYRIPLEAGNDLPGLVALFKQQMYDQVKSGFPRDLAEATLLTRIVPLTLMGRLLHKPFKGKMASFVFSHLGKSYYNDPEFLGSGVTNMFHMPRVPAPPGLGFFSNYYQNRLNLVISWLDGLFTEAELHSLEHAIRSKLGVPLG